MKARTKIDIKGEGRGVGLNCIEDMGVIDVINLITEFVSCQQTLDEPI